MISVKLVVQESTMAYEDKRRGVTSGDPNLMRLGQYLAWVERDAGWTWEDMEYLEDKFLKEPWMIWPQVVFAKDQQNAVTPFVLLANGDTNVQRPHINKINLSGQKEQVQPIWCDSILQDSHTCFVALLKDNFQSSSKTTLIHLLSY